MPICRELFGPKTEEIIELLSSQWLVFTVGGEEVVFCAWRWVKGGIVFSSKNKTMNLT